ncbi:MAG: 30S ribosomal protein S20 [Candidatus Pacebacteria bacterium]|nr:30S ribosomal protein S20 [Candidatus Paceibacterota bacterium]
MPITKSAKKALRQSLKRKNANRKKKEALKGKIKDIKKLLSQDKKGEALNLLPEAYKAIDKAVKTGVIKKNLAARKKSGLAKKVSSK